MLLGETDETTQPSTAKKVGKAALNFTPNVVFGTSKLGVGLILGTLALPFSAANVLINKDEHFEDSVCALYLGIAASGASNIVQKKSWTNYQPGFRLLQLESSSLKNLSEDKSIRQLTGSPRSQTKIPASIEEETGQTTEPVTELTEQEKSEITSKTTSLVGNLMEEFFKKLEKEFPSVALNANNGDEVLENMKALTDKTVKNFEDSLNNKISESGLSQKQLDSSLFATSLKISLSFGVKYRMMVFDAYIQNFENAEVSRRYNTFKKFYLALLNGATNKTLTKEEYEKLIQDINNEYNAHIQVVDERDRNRKIKI